MKPDLKRALLHFTKIVIFTFTAAYACAAFYIIVLKFTLPPSDSAHDQSLLETFGDPFVRLIAFEIASIFALLVLPVAVFSLKAKAWLRDGLKSIGAVLIFIAAITPFSPFLGAFGSPAIAIFSLVLVRFAFRSAPRSLHQTDD